MSSNAMDAQAHGERLVRPNQLLPTVLLVLGTAGVRREVRDPSLLQSQRPTCDVGWHSSAVAWLLSPLQSQRPACPSSAEAYSLSPLRFQLPDSDVGYRVFAAIWRLSFRQS